jgi:hypothetical protein
MGASNFSAYENVTTDLTGNALLSFKLFLNLLNLALPRPIFITIALLTKSVGRINPASKQLPADRTALWDSVNPRIKSC